MSNLIKLSLSLFLMTSVSRASDKVVPNPDVDAGDASLSGHTVKDLEKQEEQEQDRTKEEQLEEQPVKEGSVEAMDTDSDN